MITRDRYIQELRKVLRAQRPDIKLTNDAQSLQITQNGKTIEIPRSAASSAGTRVRKF